MTKNGKRELLSSVRAEYLKVGKVENGRILDQFVRATGYHRKYAISLLKHGPSTRSKQKRGNRRRYGLDVVAALARYGRRVGICAGNGCNRFCRKW